MSLDVQLRDLLDAGVHFGHQASRWNPKMRPYIYGERNGIHIVDLQKTQQLFEKALKKIQKTVSEGGHILFVATKKNAQEAVVEEAGRCGMFYVDHRWLGGMLTNYSTVRASVMKLKRIEKMAADGTYESMTKKEVALKERQRIKLERSLGGIKDMPSMPSLLFVIDARKEATAIAEARTLGIPIIAVTDTNADPDGIDYVVPGNDDSLNAIRLYVQHVAEACLVGKAKRKTDLNQEDAQSLPDGARSIKVKRLKQKDEDQTSAHVMESLLKN